MVGNVRVSLSLSLSLSLSHFGRVFEGNKHAKSDAKKIVVCPQNHSFNGLDRSYSHLLNKPTSTKIYPKVCVFWECALGRVLDRFWEGFWEAKCLDFLTSFDVFSKQNLKLVLDRSKIAQKKKTILGPSSFRSQGPLGGRGD